MERWSIDVHKDYLKFSAAHFLIFPDGTAERLHGHNYKVYVDVAADLSTSGLVVDFKRIKPIIRELVDDLDEHWLVPADHPGLDVTRRDDGVVEVRYQERYYAAPAEDVLVLPINNTSAENLATYVGRLLRERLEGQFDDVEIRRLEVAVEETVGQRGVYEYRRDES